MNLATSGPRSADRIHLRSAQNQRKSCGLVLRPTFNSLIGADFVVILDYANAVSLVPLFSIWQTIYSSDLSQVTSVASAHISHTPFIRQSMLAPCSSRRSNAGVQSLNVGSFRPKKVTDIHSSRLTTLVAVLKETVVLYISEGRTRVPT
jgi:hypothetical protein